MKKIVFLVLLLGFTQSVFSWSRYDTYPTPADQETQLKLEEMQRQLQQAEIDRELEKEVRENATKEAAEQARQEAEERAREATEQAEQAAEELRNEMLRSSIRTKNSIYLGVLLLAIGGFVIYFITRNNKEKPMNENQKYGVITMIVSFLLILLSLMISEGWRPQLDYLENLMNLLEIKQLGHTTVNPATYDRILNPDSHEYVYLIDIPTKYVVLIFMSTASYGLTTYLGITPAFKPWKKTTAK